MEIDKLFAERQVYLPTSVTELGRKSTMNIINKVLIKA
jgi:hypothetical protein